MAESFDRAASSLVCEENSEDCNGAYGSELSPSGQHLNNCALRKDPNFRFNRSDFLIVFPIQSEETLRLMVERERDHLPRDDYLKRLRRGDLDLSVRREAFDWICKASTHHGFGPLCVCLSMNYLDRFLSVYELPKGKAWTIQLLAVACLSLAAKMEEPDVPLSVDLQVGDPKFLFEAKTIQRMELLVLCTLKWRMQALTPCSYIDYFLSKMGDNLGHLSVPSITKSVQLIISITKGIDFLEFSPSEIAAAVAVSVSAERQAMSIDKATSCFLHIEKVKVTKCIELIKDFSLISASSSSTNAATTSAAPSVPQSPNGVLDAACLSYKSDELTVGSCANSVHIISESKRRKPDRPS